MLVGRSLENQLFCFSCSLARTTLRGQKKEQGRVLVGAGHSAWLLGILWERLSLTTMAKSPLSQPQLPLLLNWDEFPINRWHQD